MAGIGNPKLEYVMSRKDVAIVGGSFGQERTLSFGDESFVVRSGDGEIRIGLFANALEVTDEDGREELFLIRALVPTTYQRVEVGKTYAPKSPKKGKGKGKVHKSPVVESFPIVTHSTSLTFDKIAGMMVADGTCVTPPALRPVVLFVILSQGRMTDEEWDEGACLSMLASMRSGDMSSATLNKDGQMSVEVVAKVGDMPLVATESVIAMDAYCRRMDLLFGHGWEEKTNQQGMMRSLSGSTLWGLIPFLLRWTPGEPRHVAEATLPSMRLRRQLARHVAKYGSGAPSAGRVPEAPVKAVVEYDGMRSLGIIVSLVALMDSEDRMSADLERFFPDRDGVSVPSLATELGRYVTGAEDARNLLMFAGRDFLSPYDEMSTMICLTALLGSDEGRRLVTGREAGRSVASMILTHAAKAFTQSDDAWGDWVARQVRDIVGSVAYADAVAETVPDLCDALELSEAWDILSKNSLLGVEDACPDWARLAAMSRETYAKWQRDKESKPELGDFYDDWDGWDDYDNWDSYDSCLYSIADECGNGAYAADRFVELCRLVRACRHSFRYLDAMGWRTFLSEVPELRLILDDDGTPKPLHNDVVAAAYAAFHDLMTEESFDDRGNPVGIRLPRVIMDDGSVMALRVERAVHGEGFVGRMACEGDESDGDALYLLPADMRAFESVSDIESFVFSVCVASDDEEHMKAVDET